MIVCNPLFSKENLILVANVAYMGQDRGSQSQPVKTLAENVLSERFFLLIRIDLIRVASLPMQATLTTS